MPCNCKSDKKIKTEIHCPVSGCLYSSGSNKFFTGKKFLNQHIAKVHAEKKYSCAKCNKCFGLDWWRKHHEKTCGIEWKCDCGVTYASRETLLTHARRNQHKLPDFVLFGDKMKQCKMNVKSAESPVIVVIQPIIQNLTCIQPVQTSVVNPRPILPKISQPVLFTVPVSMNVVPNMTRSASMSSVVIQPSSDNLVFNTMHPVASSERRTLPNQFVHSPSQLTDKDVEKNLKQVHRTVGTQTLNEFDCTHKSRQSRASQCVRRKMKSREVGIESTHTQTAESAVVKIKKRRSRRKSVAITTESNMLTDQNRVSGQSLWPGFEDFICQQTENSKISSVKSSAGTQTNANKKTLCDSETITEDNLFQFQFSAIKKEVNSTENCGSSFEMLSNIAADIEGLSDNIDHSTLPVLNMFDNNSMIDNTFATENQKHKKESEDFPAPVRNQIENVASSMFSMFNDCTKPTLENKVSPPISSTIHTQTIAPTALDYNLLANMETQTTDEFIFSDLEFSDTETQTPWEDFPNIDESPLQTDQLSIEIQTDFSDFPPGFNQDPYEFINNMDVQNMIGGCSSKETFGVNIETQTQDIFNFPQFTNSESQTLEMSNFVFESLQ